MAILVLKTAAHFAEQMTAESTQQEEMANRYGGSVRGTSLKPEDRIILFSNPGGYEVNCHVGQWFIKHPDTRVVQVMNNTDVKKHFKSI